MRCHHIYRTDAWHIMRSGARWLAAMMLGRAATRSRCSTTRRCAEMLEQQPDVRAHPGQHRLGRAVRGLRHRLGLYHAGRACRSSRAAAASRAGSATSASAPRCTLKLDYLLASAALPFIFPAVKVHREYFGDGSMRQIAPVSPALHLGADRVLIVGTGRQTQDQARARSNVYPSLAQIAGHALNSIFLDSLAVDIERLERINRTVQLIPPERLAGLERAAAAGEGAVHHALAADRAHRRALPARAAAAPCASSCGRPARSTARARTWRATCCSRSRSAARSSTWATRTPSAAKPRYANSSTLAEKHAHG